MHQHWNTTDSGILAAGSTIDACTDRRCRRRRRHGAWRCAAGARRGSGWTAAGTRCDTSAGHYIHLSRRMDALDWDRSCRAHFHGRGSSVAAAPSSLSSSALRAAHTSDQRERSERKDEALVSEAHLPVHGVVCCRAATVEHEASALPSPAAWRSGTRSAPPPSRAENRATSSKRESNSEQQRAYEAVSLTAFGVA